MIEELQKVFEILNLSYDENKDRQYQEYMEGILEWNEHVNLTAIKDRNEFIEKHYIDSLLCAGSPEFRRAKTIIDVGTGGGFPGIPLAILFPECKFHLLDRIGKKVKVASEIAQSIGLQNVTCRHCGVEEEKSEFDFVVSRAVMPLNDLMKLIRKNIRKKQQNAMPNGLICLKGGELQNEVAPFKKISIVYNLKEYFKEEYFDTKKVVCVPVHK